MDIISHQDGSGDVVDEGTADADSQTMGLYLNIIVGLPIVLVCLFAFDPLRRMVPSVFETRRKLHDAGEPLDYYGHRVTTPPSPSYKFLGWLAPTLRLDLETVADTHGLDTALFLRYHRFMIALFTVFCLPTIILAPTYYTAGGSAKGVNKFSISNISVSAKGRFWIALFVEYFIVGFVCYFVHHHFTLYCRDRRRYRAARHPANYAILVQDVPQDARTASGVKDYWDLVFPGQIASVFYVHDARKLEKFKASFWDAVAKREAAEWRAHNFEQRAILRQQKKQERLRRRVMRREKRLPPEERTIQDDGNVHEEHATNQNSANPETQNSPGSARDDVVEVFADQNSEDRRICGVFPARGQPKDPHAAVRYWEEKQRKAWARVETYQMQRDEGCFVATGSAIVVFKSRRSASIAAQTNFSRREDEWRVSRAPEPNAINWGALCVAGWTIHVRQAITIILSLALTTLWFIPVVAIMSLVSLSSLVQLEINGQKPFSFLKKFENLSPWSAGVIESFLPVTILSIFLSLVPTIFGFFVSISRIVSNAERDRQVRDWYFAFVTFSNFVFVAFAGTVLKELQVIFKTPTRTVDILARNIPKQAAFMMNFILLTATREVPLVLLQLGRVFFRWFKLKFLARTERARKLADVGEMSMDFVDVYSTSQLVTLLGMVYSTIQPFITLCCLLYHIVVFVVYKYNLLFSYYNEYEDGGRMFGGALYAVWVGLFVHLLTMVGVFGLNKSPAQSVLIIIPTALSVMFLLHCFKSFHTVLEHGSALETQDRVEKLEGLTEDYIEDEVAESYEHPGWEQLPDYPDLENLNGIETEEDRKRAELDEQEEEDRRIEKLLASDNSEDSTSNIAEMQQETQRESSSNEIDADSDQHIDSRDITDHDADDYRTATSGDEFR